MNIYATKKGLSLTEMIITIAIVVIAMGGFTVLFARVWQVNAFTIEAGIASLAASRGVDNAVEHIRNARQAEDGSFPIVSATDDEMIFYTDYDADGVSERVRYFINNQKFSAGIIEPNFANVPPTYDGTENVEELAEYVVNTAVAEDTFQYFSDASSIYEYDDIEGEALSTPASVQDVHMVRILLHVNPNPGVAPENVIIQSFVTVRNLSDFDNIAP